MDSHLTLGHHDGSSQARLLEQEALLAALPAEQPLEEGAADNASILGLVEALLKNPTGLDRVMNGDERRPVLLIPRFLAIALTSYVLFSVAMIVILNTAPASAYPAREPLPAPPAAWSNGSALGLLAAYTIGLVATTCICLPTFYFFSLLAGVKLTMLQVVGQVVRSKASAAIVLVGILPIYVAVVLGLIVFQVQSLFLEYCLYLGLTLPFIAGLEGVHSIYQGVRGLALSMPTDRRERRECFLRRLTLSWAAVYTMVAPVMIYQLWDYLAKRLA